MTFKIAIASGKGGTGKTTVSVNLYKCLSEKLNDNVQLIDCDAEEPNDFLFFKNAKIKQKEVIQQLVPKIDLQKCTFCEKCSEYCMFNAIPIIPSAKYANVNTSLCHSCGACSVACQFDAISEYPVEIGVMRSYLLPEGDGLIEGKLKIGSPMQTMVIKETKKYVSDNSQIVLFDAPPGTSCPVVETITECDYVILVTEPTPFGLHDMKLMVELLNELEKPFGIIVNKAGLGDNETHQYIEKEGFELLGEIPFMKSYASDYANGNLFKNIPPEIEKTYNNITKKIVSKMNLK